VSRQLSPEETQAKENARLRKALKNAEADRDTLATAWDRVTAIVDGLIEGGTRNEVIDSFLDAWREASREDYAPNEWWIPLAEQHVNSVAGAWKDRALFGEKRRGAKIAQLRALATRWKEPGCSSAKCAAELEGVLDGWWK